MQKLQFEASWDKAIAAKDRQEIERVFFETKNKNTRDILCSPIREAINHKAELLVSVLVHNFTDEPLTINHTRFSYKIQGEVLADKVFSLPMLTIPSKMSMPWTFIFPKDCYILHAPFENGQLEIEI